jgi:hypothetical protein
LHVEIRRSLRHARVFNLDEAEVRERVLVPWSRGRPVELGEHEWDPRDSVLTILDGPALEPVDLAHGQGWHHAQRSARDVTSELLRTAFRTAVAVRAETVAARQLATAALGRLDVDIVDWAPVRGRLLARAPVPDDTIAVLVLDGPASGASCLLDVGLAVGAFGPRAIVASVDGTPPDAGELEVLALQGDGAARLLEERVRAALSAPY